MASEGAKDMTKGARDGDSLAWALLYRAVRPAILPAPHSQPPGGVSSRNFRTFFKTAAVVRSKKAKFPTGKKRMRGNLKSANIRLLGLLLLFLITASGVFAFHAEKSHQGKPAVSVETALKAIDFASKNDISIDSEFSANLRQTINFNRNRYYSPALGRFVSKDPIGFAADGNLYRYVANNPLIYIDPLGLDLEMMQDSSDPNYYIVYDDADPNMTPLYRVTGCEIDDTAKSLGIRHRTPAGMNSDDRLIADAQMALGIAGTNALYVKFGPGYGTTIRSNPPTRDANLPKISGDTVSKTYSHTTVSGQSAITDGKYTTDPIGMARHQPGTAPQYKSVFKSGVDTEQMTLRAAQYADSHGLWNAQNKAKVPVNGTIGYLSNGEPTKTINVYRKQSGKGYLIHGSPGSN